MNKHAISVLAGAAAFGLVSATYAADFVEPVADYPIIPSSPWNGGYVGVFGGFGWGNIEHDPFDPIIEDEDVGLCFPGGCDFDMNGWLVGVDVGWNYTLYGSGSAVIGIAGDIAWAGFSGDHLFEDEFGDIHSDINFEGSLRGVVGWDGGAWMPYLTAGVSFVHVNHRFDVFDDDSDPFEDDRTHVGGTAGVGVAYAVTEDLFLDLQWRTSWYEKDVFNIDLFDVDPSIGLATNRFTAGLNWSF